MAERLPARRKAKANLVHRVTTEDLVNRDFRRDGRNQLWMTSIDRRPTAAMVNAALGMAIAARRPAPGSLIHSDHGSQGEID